MVGKKNILFRQDKLRREQGFGLVELTVSIGIMVMILGLILIRHDSFNSATLLRNQAYEVALTIREKQVLATSATRDAFGFRNVYGLRFTPNSSQYIIFRDGSIAANYRYDAGEETPQRGLIDRRFVIGNMTTNGTPLPDGFEVMFERPNFDAILYDLNGNRITGPVELNIALRSDPNEFYTIEITASGQIMVR